MLASEALADISGISLSPQMSKSIHNFNQANFLCHLFFLSLSFSLLLSFPSPLHPPSLHPCIPPLFPPLFSLPPSPLFLTSTKNKVSSCNPLFCFAGVIAETRDLIEAYLLGLLAKIKCSICSYQLNL